MATRRIKGAALEKAVKALEKLPQLPRKERTFSTREAVQVLTAQILSLQKRGYSTERISTELKKLDIEISPASLRRYLGKPKATETDPEPETSAPAGQVPPPQGQ